MMTRHEKKKIEVIQNERDKQLERQKRSSGLFQRRGRGNVVADILVNENLKKIKLEPDLPPSMVVKVEEAVIDNTENIGSGTTEGQLLVLPRMYEKIEALEENENESGLLDLSPSAVVKVEEVVDVTDESDKEDKASVIPSMDLDEESQINLDSDNETCQAKSLPEILKTMQALKLRNKELETEVGDLKKERNLLKAINAEHSLEAGALKPLISGQEISEELSSERTRSYVDHPEHPILQSVGNTGIHNPSNRFCGDANDLVIDEMQNENRHFLFLKEHDNVDSFLEDAILEYRAGHDITYYDLLLGSVQFDDDNVECVDIPDSNGAGELEIIEESENEENSEQETESESMEGTESEGESEDLDKELEELRSDLGNEVTSAQFQSVLNTTVKTSMESSSTAKYLNTLRHIYTFVNKESMNAFVWGVSGASVNPFVGRSVKFMVTRETLQMEDILSKEQITLKKIPKPTASFKKHLAYFNNYQKYCTIMRAESMKFWNDVAEFLGVLGQHVWEMTIVQEDCGLTPAYLLEILTICLPHTPNLKKLVIEGSFSQILLEPKVGSEDDYDRWTLLPLPDHLKENTGCCRLRVVLGGRRKSTKRSQSGVTKAKPVPAPAKTKLSKPRLAVGKLWWHPLLLTRMEKANEFVKRASLPKLLYLKMIKLDLQEYIPKYIDRKGYIPKYMDDNRLSSTQGFSICNYVFLKHKKIMSSKLWSSFPALNNVCIKFAKRCVVEGYATDSENSSKFLPFLRTWVRNGGQNFEESDFGQRMNPIIRFEKKEFVCSFEKPNESNCEYIEENTILYIPPPIPENAWLEDWKNVCIFCNNSKFTGDDFEAHLRRHTEEKPFICPTCQEEYATNAGLRSHIRKGVCLLKFPDLATN